MPPMLLNVIQQNVWTAIWLSVFPHSHRHLRWCSGCRHGYFGGTGAASTACTAWCSSAACCCRYSAARTWGFRGLHLTCLLSRGHPRNHDDLRLDHIVLLNVSVVLHCLLALPRRQRHHLLHLCLHGVDMLLLLGVRHPLDLLSHLLRQLLHFGRAAQLLVDVLRDLDR